MTNKKYVFWLGVIMFIAGIIGFVNDPLLGLFAVNAVHNWVHILTGVFAIVLGLTNEFAAKTFAKIFGIVYLLVAIVGFFTPSGNLLGMEINNADNWLHVLIAALFIFVGFYTHVPKRNMRRA